MLLQARLALAMASLYVVWSLVPLVKRIPSLDLSSLRQFLLH